MLAGERPRCSSLKIREVGRGIVYFGSARFEPGTPLYEKAKDLARRLAATLQCPSWSGGGKGIMGAVTHGAIHGCVRRQQVMVVLSFVTPSVVLQSSLKILSNPHKSRKRLRLLLHGLTVVVVMVSLIPFSRQTRCGDPQLSAHVEAARVVHVNDRKQRWSPGDDYHRACIPLVRDSGEHSAHSHRNVAQNTSQAPPRRLDLDPKVSLRR